MSAHERNAARYRLDGGVNAWSMNWVLDGYAVLCAGCCAGQCARDAGEPFPHAEGCRLASDFAKHPWHDLAALLRELPAVPA